MYPDSHVEALTPRPCLFQERTFKEVIRQDFPGLVGSVQLLNCVRLFATSWTAAHRASLSITNSQILLKLMPIESVMPSKHHILCRSLLLLPQICYTCPNSNPPPAYKSKSFRSIYCQRRTLAKWSSEAIQRKATVFPVCPTSEKFPETVFPSPISVLNKTLEE